MPLLGLLNTDDFASQRFTNIRRRVFYHWPNGAAPLTGLLSMLEGETLNDPEFSWWEKRLPEQRTTTAANSSNGPFAGASATVNTGWGTTAKTTAPGFGSSTTAITKNDYLSVYVADTSKFRIGHVIKIEPLVPTVATTVATLRIVLVVEGFNSTGTTAGTTNPAGAGRLSCRVVSVWGDSVTQGIVNNSSTTNVGIEVLVVGTAFDQGAAGPTAEVYTLPIQPGNYSQIFRTPFSFTGTALKTGAKFDATGPYKDKAKDHSIQHMIELEKAFLFGEKQVVTNSSVPRYYTGGIIWYIMEYEKAGGGTVGYRPGGAALTADTSDDKRIITNSAGTLSHATYNTYLERLFRVTNNVASEKLCLCGSGFLSVINQMYANKTMLTNQQGSPSTYGMTVVQHDTPFGTIYYKSHPLFSQNATLRYNGLFVDVQNLRYRYLTGRDTQLLKNRQNNGDDFRRDEWLTEAGLELRFPESFMYLQNVTNYTP